jgi:hypothetical protein
MPLVAYLDRPVAMICDRHTRFHQLVVGNSTRGPRQQRSDAMGIGAPVALPVGCGSGQVPAAGSARVHWTSLSAR